MFRTISLQLSGDLLPCFDGVPSGDELEALAMEDLALDADDLHDHLMRLGAIEALVAGLKHQAVAQVCQRYPSSAPELVSSALDETTAQAERICTAAVALTREHPQTISGLLAGTVGARHAAVLARACQGLPLVVARGVDAVIWDRVPSAADPTVVRRAAHALAQSLDPSSADRRARTARAGRFAEFLPGPDGTTWFGASLCTEDALACRDALNAGTAVKAPGDQRPRAARITDLLVERITGHLPLIAGGTPTGEEPTVSVRADRRVEVQVLVPLDVVLGLSDGPASLGGQAVPAALARALARSETAVLRRMITDPLTGALLDRSPTTYRPGTALSAFIAVRDQECVWPGCHVRARICDLDHKTPAPTGPTTRANLHALCRHHHQLKHSPHWHLETHRDGTSTLHGPTGTPRTLTPPDLEEPLWYEPLPPKPQPTPTPVPPHPDDEPPF